MKEQKIINELKDFDFWYHNTDCPLISDDEYDKRKSEAMRLYPNNSYFKSVGSDPVGDEIDLPYILGSLTKTKPDGSLMKWINDNDVENIVIADKLDGVSVYAKYEDGKLVMASTRGNGYKGSDITNKINIIQPTIDTKGTVEIRGEALMSDDDCESLGYSLPRSAVSGILNGDEQKHLDMCKYITIIWYNVFNVAFDCYTDHYYFIKNAGIMCCDYTVFHVDENLEYDLPSLLLHRKSECGFAIDGLVVSDNSVPDIGEDYYPSNSVAFKVNESAVYTKVTDIIWNVTRTGKVVPIVTFDTIVISGSKVSKATGFNKKFIIDNNIGVGSEIGIVKSGDIIPYIIDVKTGNDTVIYPDSCPFCGSLLDESDTGVDLYCPNKEGCPSQQLYRIEHFLLSHEVEEISISTLKLLGITSIEELYSLTVDGIASIDGMGKRKAEIILEQLKKTKYTTPQKMLKSFGIKGIGNTISDQLINIYGSIDDMFDVPVGDFQFIDGIGEVLAKNIVDGLNQNRKLYNFLKNNGLEFEQKRSSDFQGKIFTLTGKSDISRNDLTKMIVSHGGMVKGISKSVDYLVTNDVDSQTGKAKKARQYGVEIITYDEFISMIR